MPTPVTPKIKHLDRRVQDRYLRRGILADKDFKQHLKDLPDLEGQYESINLDNILASDEDEGADEDAGEETPAS